MTIKGYLIVFAVVLLLRLILPQTTLKLLWAPFKLLTRFNLNAMDILVGALVAVVVTMSASLVGGLFVVALVQLGLTWVFKRGLETVACLSLAIGYGAFGWYLVRTSRARALEHSTQGS
ncbi:MAG TPA: hypothetical protein VMA09_04505 [Candidatus Binataceae bacterium]|nr:hypothetical protein [Candidatus Binataceae bacterium]